MSKILSGTLLSRYRKLIYDRYGIQFHGDKVEILEMKLIKLANALDCSLEDFYDLLVIGDKHAIDELLHAITVGHTFFFREEPHLTYLVNDIRKKRIARPLIWCAASSTGEEPYSIVIFLLESGITEFRVISTDVSINALRSMHRGIYHINQFQSTTDKLLRKYFQQNDPYTWRIKPGLRDFLRIKRLNLHSDILFETSFDYIFCRNVMIYFDENGRQKVLANLVQNLKPDGFLFVGHSEAMLTIPHELRKEGPAVFRRIS